MGEEERVCPGVQRGSAPNAGGHTGARSKRGATGLSTWPARFSRSGPDVLGDDRPPCLAAAREPATGGDQRHHVWKAK